MSQVTEQLVLDTLKTVIEPAAEKDIVSLDMISGLVVKDGNIGFELRTTRVCFFRFFGSGASTNKSSSIPTIRSPRRTLILGS